MNKTQAHENIIFVSTHSLQAIVVLIIVVVFSILFELSAIQSGFGYEGLIFSASLPLIFINLLYGNITLTSKYIVASLDNKIYLEQIDSISIAPYGRSINLLGIPGFMLLVQKAGIGYWKSKPLQFTGYSHPHELTKLFINTTLQENPSVKIAASLLRAYGNPPYTIEPRILEKITRKSQV